MKDCGMVCREHKVELRDTKGVDHPLQADQECRNTMFNGVAQSVASELPDLMACGVRHFRIEALTEDVVTLREKIKGYLGVLQGQLTGRELKDQLGLKEKFGVTEGQWLNNQDYQDRKKL
jgi:putative protease